MSPASINGLVGVKPTVGLIGGAGIIPISHSQDTAGPMARTVRDATMLLEALAAKDPYTKSLDAGGLKGARLGIARKFFDKNPPIDRFLTQCVDALRQAGAEIVDPADLPSHGKWDEPEGEVLRYEFKADLNAYLAKPAAGRQPMTLKDLIEFNEKHRDREMPYFEQELFVQSEEKGPLTEAKYLEARAACIRLTRQEGIDAVLAKYKLDAIVSITNGPACYHRLGEWRL